MLLPQQLAAAHHEDLHAGLTLRSRDGDEVHVDARTPHDFLRFGDASNGNDAVAQPRRRLKIEMLRRVGHFVLEAADERVLLAFEEQHDLVDEPVVVVFGLIADARRQAAFDVILQARPFAFAVDRFAAGPQRKHDAHQVDELAQSVRIGVRPEIPAAVVFEVRVKITRGNGSLVTFKYGKALVVAQPDVERRLMPLDEVRLENQRLDLVRDDNRAHIGDALDHRTCA